MSGFAAGLLVHMDFRTTPRRWWNGYGDLKAGGNTWTGLGDKIEVSGLGGSIGSAARGLTFTIKGIDADLLLSARKSSEDVKGRWAYVYLQVFEVEDGSFQNKGPLLPRHVQRMDEVQYNITGQTREIVITAESVWAGRNRAPYGRLTDMDQRARFEDDRGLELVAGLNGKTVRFPDF